MKFEFNKDEYDYLVEKCMLNDEMKKILEMKIKGCSIVQISLELHISERTVNRRINKLKKKIMKSI